MGYDIYIGNTEMRKIDPEELEPGEVPSEHYRDIKGERVYFYPRVNRMTHNDAPTFPGDGMTANGNSRHPGYAQWARFCETAGLTELFFDDKTGLMRNHSGYEMLKNEHALEVKLALKRWQDAHPGAVPGFGEEYDPILARLLWLDWWVSWALENCETPGIYNF